MGGATNMVVVVAPRDTEEGEGCHLAWGEGVVHGFFWGLMVGIALYGLSLTPLYIFPAVAVFLGAGCCLCRSWEAGFIFAAAVSVLLVRLDDTVRALESGA